MFYNFYNQLYLLLIILNIQSNILYMSSVHNLNSTHLQELLPLYTKHILKLYFRYFGINQNINTEKFSGLGVIMTDMELICMGEF